MLTYDWITTDRGLDGLRADWSRLDDGSAPGTIFRSWEWQAAWWRTVGLAASARRELRVLVAREPSGRARAILPMYVEDAPVAHVIRRRRVRLLADGTVGSDYLGLVAPAADLPDLAAPIAERVAMDPVLAGTEVLQLTDLRRDDLVSDALAAALTAAAWEQVRIGPRYVCPYARTGGDFDGYLASRPDGFGRQIAQRARRLGKLPGFRIDIHREPDAAAMDALFALHRARWAQDGGSQGFTSDEVERFHRRVVPLLAELGRVRVGILHADDTPIAAGYAFVRGGALSWYQSGMLVDGEHRRHSPGMVLMVEMLRRAAAEGVTEFDFLHGEEPYKAVWATDRRTTCTLEAIRPTAAGRRAARARALIDRARAAARSHLPPRAASAIRRILGRSA